MIKVDYLDVGGHRVGVFFDDTADMDGYAGRYFSRSKRINVSNRALSDSELTQNFIHEITHVIDEVFLNNSLSEEQINGLSQGLTQVLPQLGLPLLEVSQCR